MVKTILSVALAIWLIVGLINPKMALSFLIKDEAKRSRWLVFGLYLICALVLSLIFSIGSVKTESKSSSLVSKPDSTSIASKETKTDVPKPEPKLVGWEVSEKIDEMTDTKNVWKSIRSLNGIQQEFPYNDGQTYATITVRYMKKYGDDVLISINQGQIHGNSFSNSSYITVRFDTQSPKKYYFNEAADGSTEMVFLKNSKDFIENAKKAKDIKIEIPLFMGGNPLFRFHVDKPLEWK